MSRRPIILSGLAIVAVLVAGGCADDDDAATSEPAATSVPAEAEAGTGSSAVGTAATQPGAITEQTEAPEGPTTTPAPTAPPTTGDINEVVEAAPVETLASTPLDEVVEVAGTARIEITGIERVEAEARLPGEIAGPALAVSVSISNTTDAPIDLAAVTVNLFDAAGGASAPLTAEPNAPLEGELAPGEDAEGVYLFDFGADRSEPITIEVSAAVGTPTAVFVGSPN